MSQTPATRLKIALAQANPVVGDLDGNIAKLRAMRAKAADADLIVFPELFVTGYPPEDLVLKPAFQAAARARVEGLAANLGPGPAVLTGTVWPEGGKVYNAIVLLEADKVAAVIDLSTAPRRVRGPQCLSLPACGRLRLEARTPIRPDFTAAAIRAPTFLCPMG